MSAILFWAYDLDIADPIPGAAVAMLILLNTWRLPAKVIHVLLEGVPARIDVYRLCSTIKELPGVTVIHDVHVWTLTPGCEALTAHELVDPDREEDNDAPAGPHTAHRLRGLRDRAHPIQLETSAAGRAEDHHMDHLMASAAS